MADKVDPRLVELATLFFKLGVIGFGGPAAHIALMEQEVVEKRGWIDREHFLDLVGATNLIPGPNSTEMAIHIGYIRAGLRGLVVAGAAFIAPAFTITLVLAWMYVQYAELPAVEPFLLGIKPAVIAVILGAVYRLGRQALKSWLLAGIAVLVALASTFGLNAALALLGGAALGMLLIRLQHSDRIRSLLGAGMIGVGQLQAWIPLVSNGSADITIGRLALFFLKIGAVLYGSGYVLVAFLETELVSQLGWLTQSQLLDAISAGQFTPGPVLTTSAFIGFLLLGPLGAGVAAFSIFLPSFFFVLLLNPLIPRLRKSPWSAAFLDGANVSAVAIMVAVLIDLARGSLTSLPAWGIFLSATAIRLQWRVNPAWLILGGAVVGALVQWI